MNYTKITVEINTKDKPAYFMGSEIRGAFGYALKTIYGEEKVEDNLFYLFYTSKNSFRPFRLDFKLGSYSYEFSIILFDKYTNDTPFVISALHEMITKTGFGIKSKRIYDDFKIYVNDKCIYKNKKLKVIRKQEKKFKLKKHEKCICIELLTPLRIKKDNRFIRNSSLQLEDILTSIYKKKQELTGNKVYRLNYSPRYEYVSKDISFKDLSRFSSVQDTSMKLGGMIGRIEVKKLDKQSYELLKQGEILGVGKETSFGLGKIKVRVINE